mmetsp:Transcript_78797/g.225747  ORF Transcript_78797/g.225747 Transcript_78797/m.225747 type:complete len:284 (+) Transcript_78797:1082-1933(+)
MMHLTADRHVRPVDGELRVVSEVLPKFLEGATGVLLPMLWRAAWQCLLAFTHAVDADGDALDPRVPAGEVRALQRGLEPVPGLRCEGSEEVVRLGPVVVTAVHVAVVGDLQHRRLLVPGRGRALRAGAHDVEHDTAVAAVAPALIHPSNLHLHTRDHHAHWQRLRPLHVQHVVHALAPDVACRPAVHGAPALGGELAAAAPREQLQDVLRTSSSSEVPSGLNQVAVLQQNAQLLRARSGRQHQVVLLDGLDVPIEQDRDTPRLTRLLVRNNALPPIQHPPFCT